MKLKDLVNPKINKANGQISLDVRKSKLKSSGVDIEEILEMKLNKNECKFKDFD